MGRAFSYLLPVNYIFICVAKIHSILWVCIMTSFYLEQHKKNLISDYKEQILSSLVQQ